MPAQADRLTVDAFWQEYGNKPYELIDGAVIRAPSKNPLCGLILSCATRELGSYIEENDLGQLMLNVGFALSPMTLYGADLAYVSNAKLQEFAYEDDYLRFAPDLIIKVVSHQEKAQEVQDRVTAFLEAGSVYVWLIYARSGQVVVYDALQTAQILSLHQELSGGDVLPGFNVPVSKLFPAEIMDI
jgi:Uma2 family endonuclease